MRVNLVGGGLPETNPSERHADSLRVPIKRCPVELLSCIDCVVAIRIPFSVRREIDDAASHPARDLLQQPDDRCGGLVRGLRGLGHTRRHFACRDRSLFESIVELRRFDHGINCGINIARAWTGCDFGAHGVADLSDAVGHGGCWSVICAAPVEGDIELVRVRRA